VLALEGVGKRFWRGDVPVTALREATLQVAAGEFVGVWGALGSGKSTLLRLAAGLEQPDEGVVRFEGSDLAKFSRRQMRHLRRYDLGLADRSGPWERITTLDYVALPLMRTVPRTQTRRRAMEALQQLGLDPRCGSLYWDELTDGERTLASIAHAVVRQPKLLLVDNPTSSLGFDERERTIRQLHRFADEGIAVLMTAPDMPATLTASHTYTLTAGTLEPDTPPPTGSSLLSERSCLT